MPYIYLVVSVFMNASSSIFGKFFSKKNEDKIDSNAFYNFLQLSSVCFLWAILYILDFSFEITVLWYAVLFAAFYTACNIGIIYALKYGPATLTSLFTGLSLIVTTIWGFIFWDAEFKITVAIGLVLVICSIILCLYSKKKAEKPFSWKWLFFALMALMGNAGCSIVQRTQQMQFQGEHGNMLMLFATFFSMLFCFTLYIKSNKQDTPIMIKNSFVFPVAAGVCNVILNVCVMLMALTTLSSSLIYPVIGVGGLAVVTLFSLFLFKEKMYWWQWLGFAIGIIAIGLLSF